MGADGHKLNTNEVFKSNKFAMHIGNDLYRIGLSITNENNPAQDKAEFFFKNLPHGTYHLNLSTKLKELIGNEKDGILIENKNLTEYKYMLNTDTGLEGYITNEQGIPLKEAIITIKDSLGSPTKSIRIFSTENGYYKILGLEEKNYFIEYVFKDGKGDFYGGAVVNIFIKNGIITKYNHVLKMIKIN